VAIYGIGSFAVNPLHGEVVSWITGRVDSIVTAFFVCAVCFYLYWRDSKSKATLGLCLAAFACALASKEMAVVFPPLMLLYELIFYRPDHSAATTLVQRTGQAFVEALKKTLSLWVMLALYFLLRRLALGTFIGGYDDSLSVTSIELIVDQWLHGFSMMLVPVNVYANFAS